MELLFKNPAHVTADENHLHLIDPHPSILRSHLSCWTSCKSFLSSTAFLLPLLPLLPASALQTVYPNTNNSNNDVNENVSNTSGWHLSKEVVCPCARLENPCQTSQTVGIIIYPISENAYNKFRSTLIKYTGVMKAYGHGEYLGMAIEHTIRDVAGSWGKNRGFGLCSFDTMEDAEKFASADTEVRDWLWLGGVEFYLAQCAIAMVSPNNMPYTCLEMYDVKHGANFVSAVQALSGMIKKHGGHLATASSKIKYIKGVKNPAFVCISQWKDMVTFNAYSSEVDYALRNLNAGVGTRVIAELDPFEK